MSNNLGKVCPIVLHVLENTHNLSLFCREKILVNLPVLSVVPRNTHFIRRRNQQTLERRSAKAGRRKTSPNKMCNYEVQRKQYRHYAYFRERATQWGILFPNCLTLSAHFHIQEIH